MNTESPSAPRIFKVGATRIVEDASMAALTNEQVRTLLQPSYPEVAHATIREHVETVNDHSVRLVDFMPQGGRKGSSR